MTEQTCLKIEGGKVDAEGVRAVADTVLLILESPYNDQKTKRLALKTIAKAVTAEAPSNISIHGSNFQMSQPEQPKEEFEFNEGEE